MMKLFDSHVHFCDLETPYSASEQLARATEAGVQRLLAVGGSCELNKAAAEVAVAAPDLVCAALGFDRDQVRELATPASVQDALGRLRRSIGTLRSMGAGVSAIGEIGLDYHYAAETASRQRALFEAQCGLAAGLGLPVVVHSREADRDTLAIVKDYARQAPHPDCCGVLHCFTGSLAFAEQLMAVGFMISFSGIVTFLNAEPLREVARRIPDDRLLIETDSPYLAPVPHRGRRNEPAFVREVARCLAAERGVAMETLAAKTTENAHRLLGAW